MLSTSRDLGSEADRLALLVGSSDPEVNTPPASAIRKFSEQLSNFAANFTVSHAARHPGPPGLRRLMATALGQVSSEDVRKTLARYARWLESECKRDPASEIRIGRVRVVLDRAAALLDALDALATPVQTDPDSRPR